jgi:hypothetical protein
LIFAIIALGRRTMNTPEEGLTVEGFNAAIETYLVAQCEKTDEGYRCKKCGSKIMQTTCYASIHSTEFSEVHTGSGEVKRLPLPYCPTCEGKPTETTTCIHEPFFRKGPFALSL